MQKQFMKITTGSARGKRLKSVPGEGTRPITDKVKQAVFNILMDDVRESRWLDMFGGTGAVGIEALSRGASFCTFLDTAPDAIRIISANLTATGLAGKARAIRQDAFRFLFAKPNTEYDFIYIAPPQGKGLWSRALAALNDNPDQPRFIETVTGSGYRFIAEVSHEACSASLDALRPKPRRSQYFTAAPARQL